MLSRDAVMLFCSSFTQSGRFLQTEQLFVRLQVVVVTNFIRMLMRNVIVNVFKSDAEIWWAANLPQEGTSSLQTQTHRRHPPVASTAFSLSMKYSFKLSLLPDSVKIASFVLRIFVTYEDA